MTSKMDIVTPLVAPTNLQILFQI